MALRSTSKVFGIATTATAVGLLLGACAIGAGGPRETQERDVEGLADATGVALETSGDLVVEIGDEPSLTVTARSREIDRLTSEVRDGVLVLGTTGDLWSDDDDVDYHLVLTALDVVRLGGSGDVEAGAATGERLVLEVTGSGDVTVHEVEVDALQVGLEGSGDIELRGTADHQVVTVTGSGSYDARGVSSRDAAVTLEGSGDVAVDVSDALTVSLTGSGQVTHTGGADVDSDVQGSGEVREG